MKGRLLNPWDDYQKPYIAIYWFSDNVQSGIVVAKYEGWINMKNKHMTY